MCEIQDTPKNPLMSMAWSERPYVLPARPHSSGSRCKPQAIHDLIDCTKSCRNARGSRMSLAATCRLIHRSQSLASRLLDFVPDSRSGEGLSRWSSRIPADCAAYPATGGKILSVSYIGAERTGDSVPSVSMIPVATTQGESRAKGLPHVDQVTPMATSTNTGGLVRHSVGTCATCLVRSD